MAAIATGFQNPFGDGFYLVQDHSDYYAGYGYHLGEDWSAAPGDGDIGLPVYAAANGTIVYAGWYAAGWGNVVIIQHTLPDGQTVSTVYGHLDAIYAYSGDVAIGQQIGTVGDAGVYDAHLHFAVYLGGITSPGGGYSQSPDPDPYASGWVDPSYFIANYPLPQLPDLDARNDNDYSPWPTTLSASSVTQGMSVTMQYRATNWGPGNAPSSVTGIFWSYDNVFDASDLNHLLTTDAVGALTGNSGSNEAVNFSTSGLSPGTYYIFAVADYTNNISEVNESNNPSSGVMLTITGPQSPEISVVGGSSVIADGDSTPSIAEGTDFGTVSQGSSPVQQVFTVVNSGSGTLTLGSISLPTGFTLVEGLSNSIAPGGFDTFTVQLNTSSAGSFSGQISFTTNDSDENLYNFQVAGTVTTALLPDLYAEGVSCLAQGNSVQFSYYVFNSGGNSGASVSGIYLSTDSTITTSDTLLGTDAVGAITGGGGGTGQHTVTLSTSGIAPGAYYIGVVADYNNGVAESSENNNSVSSFPITITQDAFHDFNGNGTSDILWYHASSGNVGQFVMNNGVGSWAAIGGGGAGWQVVGAGDLNGNGTDDILWHNPATGSIGQFVMNNGVASWAAIGWAGSGWQVAGVGDFNGNGTDDILLYNPTSGVVGQFVMNNGVASWAGIGWAGSGWQVVGVGDFNGNGTEDILWHNASNGLVGQFVMNNGVASWVGVGWAGAGWQVAGVGDFNGNGTDDILWYNSATGGVGQFVMNSGVASWAAIGLGGSGWQPVAVGDYNGNGTDDILWHNASNGLVGQFVMNNGVASWAGIGWAGAGWAVV